MTESPSAKNQSQPPKILLSRTPASTYSQFAKTLRSGFSHPSDKLESKRRALACRTPVTGVPGSTRATLGQGERHVFGCRSCGSGPPPGLLIRCAWGPPKFKLTDSGPHCRSDTSTGGSEPVERQNAHPAERRTASGNRSYLQLRLETKQPVQRAENSSMGA